MPTREYQKIQIIKWMQSEVVYGGDLLNFVKREGWNVWQASIVISQMVTDELLKCLGELAGTPGKVYKKYYKVTEYGIGWVGKRMASGADPDLDDTLKAAMFKATEQGRWTFIPAGVGQREKAMLHDAGFEVRTVIRARRDDER